ncbi:MAG: lipocalin family protein [Rikenellaceae bacterium]|nr:lipocalin family protein [Rikenellaceae bacterium]
MNKFRYFFLTASLLCCALCLTACNDDDDNDDDNDVVASYLLGTWNVSNVEGYEIDGDDHVDFTDTYYRGEWYFIFYSTGTYREYVINEDGQSAQREGNGSYSYYNEKLTLRFVHNEQNYEVYEYKVLELTSSRMVLEEDGEYIYQKITFVK